MPSFRRIRISAVAVAAFTAVLAGVETAAALQVPVAFHASPVAAPGDAVQVFGGDLGAADSVVAVPLSAPGATLDPTTASVVLAIVTSQPSFVQAILPVTAPSDAYAVFVHTPAGWTDAVYVNRASAFWVSEGEVFAGQSIRVVGQNMLNPSTGDGTGAAVEVVDLDAPGLPATTISPTTVTAHTMDLALPPALVVGHRHTLRVTNGAGASHGWAGLSAGDGFDVVAAAQGAVSARLGLNAAWAGTIPDQTFDATNFGAVGDGVADDTLALEAAVDAAEVAGGGIVYLPAGRYRYRGAALNLPPHTVLLGAGRDATELIYEGIPFIHIVQLLGDSTGVARITIASDVTRPLTEPPANANPFGGAVTGVFATEGGRGQFVKDSRIRLADGEGMHFLSQSDVLVEGNDVDVTHGGIIWYVDDGRLRIRDNEVFNTQRTAVGSPFPTGAALAKSARAWVEGNTLTGESCSLSSRIACDIHASPFVGTEHRTVEFAPNLAYVAGNTTKGMFGEYPIGNDGEGALWQGIDTNAFASRVSSAGQDTLTDSTRNQADNALVGAPLVIIEGRGVGQRRLVVSNSANVITVDEPWDVVPDGTSVYAVDRAVSYRNVIVDNDFEASLTSGAVMLFSSGYENVVAGNRIANSAGIWVSAYKSPITSAPVFNYFTTVSGNSVRGASFPAQGKGNHTELGTGVRIPGNVSDTPDPALPSVGLLGNEYRDNLLVGTGRVVPCEDEGAGEFNCEMVEGNGIRISGGWPQAPFGYAVATLLESNAISNTAAGVHLSNTSFHTLLHGNDFTGNEHAIRDSGSVGTLTVGQPERAPVGTHIAHGSVKALPGQLVALHGTALAGATRVVAQPLSAGQPIAVANADVELDITRASANVVEAALPSAAPVDAYALFAEVGGRWTEPEFVNRAIGLGVSETQVYPGQSVSVFGRNLLDPETGAATSTTVELVDAHGGVLAAPVALATDERVAFSIPTAVQQGRTYLLRVSNGRGGARGFSYLPFGETVTVTASGSTALNDSLGLGAAWLGAIPAQQFHASNFGATGDGTTDDTAAIQAALDAAREAGGGTVVLGAGTFQFSSLSIADRTAIVGAGAADTTLRYNGGLVPPRARSVLPAGSPFEPRKLIYSEGSAVGVANLAVTSTALRPLGTAGLFPHGLVAAIALSPQHSADGPIGEEPLVGPVRGAFVKNVRVNVADGMGVAATAQSDIIIEGSEMNVTHEGVLYAVRAMGRTPLGNTAAGDAMTLGITRNVAYMVFAGEPGPAYEYDRIAGYVTTVGRSRVRDNTVRNTQRAGIAQWPQGGRAWIARNVLEGQNCSTTPEALCDVDPTAGDTLHRGLDLQGSANFVAGNAVQGQFGQVPAGKDGDGIAFRQSRPRGYGAVTASTSPRHLSDGTGPFSLHELKNAHVTIVAGTGIGQTRAIKDNFTHDLYTTHPWDVRPDSTSVYSIDEDLAVDNLVVDNTITASLPGAAVVFAGPAVGNSVLRNSSTASGGIWFGAHQSSSGLRHGTFHYFADVSGNDVSGTSMAAHQRGGHGEIGPGTHAAPLAPVPDAALPSVGLFGNAFSFNELVGNSTSPLCTSPANCADVARNGLAVSDGGSQSAPFALGTLVTCNSVSNTVAGVHLSNSSYATTLVSNTLSGNGSAISDSGSVGTANLIRPAACDMQPELQFAGRSAERPDSPRARRGIGRRSGTF